MGETTNQVLKVKCWQEDASFIAYNLILTTKRDLLEIGSCWIESELHSFRLRVLQTQEKYFLAVFKVPRLLKISKYGVLLWLRLWVGSIADFITSGPSIKPGNRGPESRMKLYHWIVRWHCIFASVMVFNLADDIRLTGQVPSKNFKRQFKNLIDFPVDLSQNKVRTLRLYWLLLHRLLIWYVTDS